MTDPIGSMLIMIKNAGLAGHDSVTVPFSAFKAAIASTLQKEGYLKNASTRTEKSHNYLVLDLAYENKEPKVTGLDRISKPGKRVYMSVKDIRPIKNGHGLLVLSTPKGILTGREARKEAVGGEALFKIW